jgi:transposase
MTVQAGRCSTIVRDEIQIAEALRRKGMFMIATNELNTDNQSDLQLLKLYKAQGTSVERGFRFLKDPMFYAESLYLKKPQRRWGLWSGYGLFIDYHLFEIVLLHLLEGNIC